MATIIRAFVNLSSQVNNTRDAVAAIGELSTHAETFSLDRGAHTNAAYADATVYSFSCLRNGIEIAAPDSVIAKIANITKAIATQYDGVSTPTQWLVAKFPELSEVAGGDIVLQKSRNWISHFSAKFKDGTEDTVLKIWYSDEVFRSPNRGYDLVTIKVVSPVVPVTALYNTYANAKAALDATTPSIRSANKESVRNNQPYTLETTMELRWNDPADLTEQFITYWTILGHGPNSNRVDNILGAIRNYLATETNFTVDQWKAYLPDILTTENFTLIPLWDNVSLTAGPGLDSVYNPTVNQAEVVDRVKKFLPNRTATELSTQGQTFNHIWRGIPIFAIAGTSNPLERSTWKLSYPDYVVLNFNDQNLDRVSVRTRATIEAIERLCAIGLEYAGTGVLPTGYSPAIINGRTYLETTVSGMVLRVLTYKSFTA